MYRRIVNIIGKHTKTVIAVFYGVLVLRFVWSCLREAAGGCMTVEHIYFWLTGVLAMLVFCCAVFLLFVDHIRLDRILSGGRLSNILFIIAGIISVPLVFNFILTLIYHNTGNFAGEMFSGTETNERTSLMWSIFYHFIDPGNQHMAVTQRARMWTLIISMLGAVFMGGVLISYLTNLFDRRGSNFIAGRCRYRCNSMLRPSFGRFAVIIGGHDMVVGLCEDILAKPDIDNVFILTSSDVETLRSNLRSKLKKDEERVIIYYGYRGNEEELDALYLQYAEEIYIIGEGGDEALHDQLNMKCVNYLAQILPPSKNPKKCYVLFEYQTTFAAFQSSSIRSILNDRLEFVPFNYYETWAQKVVTDGVPVEDVGQPYDSNQHVQIFVVGMSRMGVALGLEYAHIAHFPNFVRDRKLRTRITFIDMNAEVESAFFMGRYKNLFDLSRWRYVDETCVNPEWNVPAKDFLDVEWEFMKGGVQTPFVRDYIEAQVADKNARVTMAVCLPNSSQSLASALYLPECMYEADNVMQVWVYQATESAIVDGINKDDMRYCKLKSFGTAADTLGAALIVNNLKPTLVCGVYGVVYEAVQASMSVGNIYEYIRDRFEAKGREDWHNSKIWEKWSNIYNACMLDVKLRSCGMTADDFDVLKRSVSMQNGRLACDVETMGVELKQKFDMLAMVEHNRWNIEKLLMGYRTLTDEELAGFDGLSNKEFDARKGELKKGVCRAHIDILPFDMLVRIDSGAEDFDYLLSLMILDIVNKTK